MQPSHCRSVAELCMLFKIKSNPMHSLSGALPLPYVPRVLLVVLWLQIGTRLCLLVVGLSIAEALCPSWCLFGMILVTLCLMVCNWWVSRPDPMLHVGMIYSFFFVSYCLSFSFFHGLVVGGWGLWTESVLTLSWSCKADSN